MLSVTRSKSTPSVVATAVIITAGTCTRNHTKSWYFGKRAVITKVNHVAMQIAKQLSAALVPQHITYKRMRSLLSPVEPSKRDAAVNGVRSTLNVAHPTSALNIPRFVRADNCASLIWSKTLYASSRCRFSIVSWGSKWVNILFGSQTCGSSA